MKKPILWTYLFLLFSCSPTEDHRIALIIDTDANNELDDQHALAYLFFNENIYDLKGITINATYNGGDIDLHYEEAKRIMHLCEVSQKHPIHKGANGNFDQIHPNLSSSKFDGHLAIDFIIKEALKSKEEKLVIVPIGKMTNIALAIKKEPKIKEKIKIVWLGSNFPEPGEYNLENDINALNYVLDQDVELEIVPVRYGAPSGSDAVSVTPAEINKKMKNKAPRVSKIEGRHGGTFSYFGNYSMELFSKIKLYGEPPSRALFDLVALAIIKNPEWGIPKTIPAPLVVDSIWQSRIDNPRKILVWENFDKKSILEDFYKTMKEATE